MERHRSWSHSILEAGSGLTFGSSDLESDIVFSLLAFLDSVVLHLKDSKGIKAPQGEYPSVLSTGSRKPYSEVSSCYCGFYHKLIGKSEHLLIDARDDTSPA